MRIRYFGVYLEVVYYIVLLWKNISSVLIGAVYFALECIYLVPKLNLKITEGKNVAV